MKKYLKKIAAFSVIAFALSACSGGGGSHSGSGGNTSPIISFDTTVMSIPVGYSNTTTLSLTNTTESTEVSISSSNTAVATISPSTCSLVPSTSPSCNVTITGVASGDTNVVATDSEGKTTTVVVHVTNGQLAFAPGIFNTVIGTAVQSTLSLSSTNESMNTTVVIKSSNPAVATFSPSTCNLSINVPNANPSCVITVTPVISGSVNFVATATDGKTATLTVNITGSQQNPNSITFNTTSSVIQTGVGVQSTVQLVLSNPTSSANFNINVASSDPAVVVQKTSCNLTTTNTLCSITMLGISAGKTANLTATEVSPNAGTVVASIPVAVVANDGTRYITFVNKCTESISLGIISASSNGIESTSAFCNTNAQCPTGSSCTQTGIESGVPIKQCFWNLPTVSQDLLNNKYALTAGATTTVSVPPSSYNPGLDIVWDGVFVARQGCNTATGVCAVASCPTDSNMGCKIGTGAQPPATQAELTMLKKGGDFYDVEVINGPNLPISIGPNNRAYPTTISGQDSYYCATAGAGFTLHQNSLPPNTIPGAPWEFTEPNASYNLVDGATTTSCSSTADCNSQQVCGYTRANAGFDGKEVTQSLTTCGNRLGYLDAFEFCANNPNSNFAPFYCSSTAAGSTYTNNQFYQCTSPLKTGYPSGPYTDTSTVCGSTNWSGIAAPSTTAYAYTNQPWINTVLPTISWLKEACPTCYTYPFDDPSSTFVCRNSNQTVPNNTNYTVTFCPDNQ